MDLLIELMDMLKCFKCVAEEVAKRFVSLRIGKMQQTRNTIRASKAMGVIDMKA